MTADVARAIDEVREAWPGHALEVLDDGSGGAYVIVADLDIGHAFVGARSWAGFHLTFQYPQPDVYPYYVRHDLARVDGAAIAAPLNPGHQMPGFDRPAVMVSRKTAGWNPAADTAALKLERILIWLKESS